MARNAIKSYLRPFCQKFKKINKVPYGSEMARNVIESEFRTSEMADQSEMARNAIQSDFQKKLKLRIDLKLPEMRSKVKFGYPRWPTLAILSKISKKN